MIDKETKKHIVGLLKKGARLDGRKALDYRDVSVEYGVTDTAEGSARVQIGDTVVIAGIKLSTMTPYEDSPDEGTLMVGAELMSMSSPEFEDGPPGIDAIELGRVCDRGIRESHAIDVKKLCIEAGEKVWAVSIDVCSMNDGGNLFDASALAAIAALKDTRMPVIGEDGAIEYMNLTDESLPLNKIPVAVTVRKIGDEFIVDPLPQEEKATDSRLTITVDENNTIISLQKGGDQALKIEEIEKMIDIAIEKSADLRKAL